MGGKDGAVLKEGKDYTLDRKTGVIEIMEGAYAKVPGWSGRIEDRGKIPLEIKIYTEGKIQW